MNGMRGLDGRTLLRRRQHGLATVEFAIALPLLLLLLLAIGEFGRMLAHYNTLLQSSRDAARYAAQNALNNTTNRMNLSDSLKATSRNLAAYGHPAVQATALLPGLTPASVQVEGVGSEHVRVTIRYRFQPVISAIPAFFGGEVALGLDLVATTVMRAL